MKPFNFFGANHSLAFLARRYYWTAGVVMLLAAAISLLEGFGIGLLIPLLGILSGDFSPGRTSHSPVSLLSMLASGHSRNTRLWIIAGAILAAVVLKTALQAAANAFASWVDGRIGQDIRCGLGRRLNSVGYPFFLAEDPARLCNILGTESWKASDAVRVLFTKIAATANVLMFGMLLLIVNWRLALLALVGGMLTRIIQKRMEHKLRMLSQNVVAVNQVLHNRMLFVIFSARLIRIFNTQKMEQEHFETSSDEVRRAILKSERISGTQGPLVEAVHGVLLVTVLLAAISTGTTLPVLATFLVLMNRVQPHLRALEGTSAAFAAATAHLDEVEWLLDPSNKASPPVGVVPFTSLRDHIVFENVTHDYGIRNAPALTDVSFVLRRGRATALLGESGSGKSTIVNLLCRLLEPTSGTIKIDGKPLHDLQVADWLNSIAIAGQDIELIDGTIAENLAYGRPETRRDEIEEAVRASHADFVRDLPLGLDTPIGQRGLGMSGGQRQRIALARALVRKPELLILDEATNALDYATEQGILRVLQELRGAITMLVVSHKADTLAFCDDALVLCQGKLVSAGPVASIVRGPDARAR
jgi:ABC-type multidrug transport system fused ATPase/permease subunit